MSQKILEVKYKTYSEYDFEMKIRIESFSSFNEVGSYSYFFNAEDPESLELALPTKNVLSIEFVDTEE